MPTSWPRFLLGVLLGFVAIVVLLVFVGFLRLQAGLDVNLASLRDYRSPPSLVLDREATPLATVSLVEPIAAGAPPPSLLAEAFLAAAPPSFYEPRVDGATALTAALARVVQGKAPSASPLSLALARALLLGEEPGPERQGREELLATALEAKTTVTERVDAWLDWVPLCRGRRGLRRARVECLGTSEEGWTDGEMATVAAAAAWGLDLAGDRGLLASRRDAVLEQLVRRGLVDRGTAQRSRPPPLVPPPANADCLPHLMAGARRQPGSSPARSLRLETAIDGNVRRVLVDAGVDRAVLLDPRSGIVVGCRGGPGAGPGSLGDQARHAIRLASGGAAPEVRWALVEPIQPDSTPLPRLDAWTQLLALHDADGLRWRLEGSRLLLAHPTLAGAVDLDDPAAAEALIEDLSRVLPRKRVLLPDDLEVVRVRGAVEVRSRAG